MERLKAELERRLGAMMSAEVEVRSIAPLLGGACQDNFRVDVRIDGSERRFVLRSDARASLPGSRGRKQEHAIIRAAADRGVRTPRAHGLFEGLIRPGADAYLMDWAEGEAIAAKVLRDPSLASARAGLPTELADVLARIHTLDPKSAPELCDPLGPPPRDTDVAAMAIASQRASLQEIPEPHPGLELALTWLERHPPKTHKVTLVHGDFRTGNFLVTPAGLSAVLDWEFARWGHPFEDIAWLCVRDWRFGQLKNAAGGFARREVFYEAYEKASGRTVVPEEVHFWEVLGNVRWAIGAVVQGLRYTQGSEAEFELVAIARRAVEMELEALRLIGGA
jgi:aminoglycoside phosphotransferase (APT) family kinase protein